MGVDNPGHSAPEQLAAFALGTLDEADVKALVEHLDACPECCEAASATSDGFVDLLKASRETASDRQRADQTSGAASGKNPGNTAEGFLRPPQAPGEIGRLAHYRVLRELGRGGMGMIFEAEDGQLRRTVALKIIRPDVAGRDESRTRFLREARAAAALKNDHIITIYQVGEDNGILFIAMEFLAGRSLEAWLNSGHRPRVSEIVILGKQIAKGLHAAHEAGLIHRDIKPANIWLESPGSRVKILDFGLARSMDADNAADPLTEAGALLGTPSYMSPEQVHGEPLDRRADLFSFGCVLYRVAAGDRPFQGSSIAAVLSAIATHIPRPAAELNPEIPPRLSDLIGRLLSKNPAERPATAKAVQEELQAIERELKASDKEGLSPAKTALIEPPAGATFRRRRTVIIAALLILALSAAWGLRQGLVTNSGGRADSNEHAETSGTDRSSKTPATDGPSDPQPPSKAVDLLKLMDLRLDAQEGVWFWKNDRLRGQDHAKATGTMRLTLPWEPPAEYRLSFRVTKLSKDDASLIIGLASGESRFALLIGQPLGSKSSKRGLGSGLAFIDGKFLTERADTRRGRRLPPDRAVFIECTVRDGRITAAADGIEFYDWSGNMDALSRVPGGATAPLFIGGSRNGAFEFESISLEPLTSDSGRPTRPAD